MKNLYLAIEERLGKIATVALFIIVFIAITVGVLTIEQITDYLNLFM